MDTNTLKGSWDIAKGKAKEKWGKLTDDDLLQINGKKDQLVGKLEQKYGYTKEEARKMVENFDNFDGSSSEG